MAAKKPTAKKTTKKATPAQPKPAAKAAQPKPAPKIFNSVVDEEARALFIRKDGLLETTKKLRGLLNTANGNLRAHYKSAKSMGFDKQDFDYAIQLETAELEAKTKARIARNLVIAKYMGSSLGAQLDLFLEPDRTPAVDRAYDEGVAASMSGETAKPGYDPSTPQHARYMEGFHADQEKRVKGGIKKMDPKENKGAKNGKGDKKGGAAPDVQVAKASPVAEEITSGVPMSRAAFLAAQQANPASGGSVLSGDPEDPPSAFQRKGATAH